MKSLITIAAALFATNAVAHEWTPTYPKLESSYIDNVLVTEMNLFNHRSDVKYYEISVFDEEWNSVSFASNDKIIKIEQFEKKTVEIYFRKKDQDDITYICTTSKSLKSEVGTSVVKSRICSKVK